MKRAPSIYLPAHFTQRDPGMLLEVMNRYNFATLYTCDSEGPMCTHLPVLASREGECFTIDAHVARMNPQWQRLGAAPALLVFHGPHTYVSPTQYKSERRVPTWNYLAVHARGPVEVLDHADDKEAILKKLIMHHDPDFDARWAMFEPEVREPLLKGIVGLRMQVDTLEGKFKLNQHRLADDRDGLAGEYAQADENRRELGEWMERLGLWQR